MTHLFRIVLTLVVVVASGCSSSPGAGPDVAAVRFIPVDLPGGAVPEVLAAAGQDVLVGVRYDSPAPHPGLLRLGPGETGTTEVPLLPATGYGRTASWYSLTSDGRQVLGVGGDRGGAHGNVRWSVWSGSDTGVHEQPQAFSTFGGWGAGDLIDGVLTPAGPAVVGSWQSTDAGLDVAVWTADGDTWTRTDSAGTPLQSTRHTLGFATDATAFEEGIVVAGWQVTSGKTGPTPVVWRSTGEDTGWTRTPLPDAGANGAAAAARCALAACAVAGRVDGTLALWRFADGTWTRVPGLPAVPVGDTGPLPAPLDPAGATTQVVSDGGRVLLVTVDRAAVTVRPTDGPTGTVTSAVEVGGSVYVLAGPDVSTLRLWRADESPLR